MPPLIRLTPELRADFVAYLDGELDEQATERIEAVLAQSNVARKDVEELAQSYELLDMLPRHAASAEFTEQTLATIRVSELRIDYRETPWFRAFQSGLQAFGWMLALAVGVAVAFLATRKWAPTETDVLIRNLPVIEQLDLYTEVGSVEFLERLDRQSTLQRELSQEGHGERPGAREGRTR